MLFPTLFITYAFLQISFCTQSDVPAEDLAQTSPYEISSTTSDLNTESGTEKITSGHFSSTTLKVMDNSDQSQDDPITTSALISHSSEVKITWNPVSSIVVTARSPTESGDSDSTLPSSTSPIVSRANTLHYQTTPFIFENLDHGENELDSDANISKITFRTTRYPIHKEVIKSENSTDSSPVLLNTAPENNSDSLLKTNLSVFNSSETTQIISESDTSTDDLKETDSLEVATYVAERTKFSSHPHHPSIPTTINSESNVTVTLQDSTTENVSTESHIETKPQESNAFYSSLNSAFTEASKNLESTEAVTLSNHAEIDSNMLTVAKDKNMVMITNQPEIAILHTTYSDTLPSEFNTDHYSTFQTDLPTVKSKDISILKESTTSRIVNVPSDHSVSLNPYTESLSPSDISGEVNNNMTTERSEKKILITDQSTLPYTLHSDIPSEFHTEKSSEFINLQESTTPRVSTAHPDRSVHAKSLDPSDVPYIPASEDDRTVFATSYDSVKTTEIGTTLSNIIDFHRTYPVLYDKKTTTVTSISEVTETEKPMISETTSHIPTFEDGTKNLTMDLTETKMPSTHVFTDQNTKEVTSTFFTNPMPTLVENVSTTNFSINIFTTTQSSIKYSSTEIETNKTKENLSTTESSILITTLKDSSSSISPTSLNDLNVKSTAENTENNIMLQTFSHPPVSTTTEHSASYADQSISTTVYPNLIFNTEETSTTSKLITSGVIYQETTITTDSSSTLKMDVQSTSSQTHREGKHIPFSTASTDTSPYSFFIVTTDKITTALDETKISYKQIQIEDLNLMDRTNMITAVIQFPENYMMNETSMEIKLTKTHQWLEEILTKEFQNWTRDPFEETEEEKYNNSFGNISIFYIIPTPETNASHITLTFVVYNVWRNVTLPAHFALGSLNFYSKNLKESVNANAVHFSLGLSTEARSYDLLSEVINKYGIIIFTICLAVVGITALICVVVYYRKKTRQSIHYLADNKLQQAVGIDLTPASIILQEEKEKGSKICDDEGWLVPIADVPVAEDGTTPNVQDTKL